jgi:predicted aconitase
MVGVTPEAGRLSDVIDDRAPAISITDADLAAYRTSLTPVDDTLHVVVFAAPQLSLIELQQLGTLLDGRTVHPSVSLIATTSPEIKSAADRLDITRKIDGAGGILLQGVCFYQMHAREIGEANGWRRLMSNSAKLVNILGGYNYETVLGSMEACVESAVAGRIVA